MTLRPMLEEAGRRRQAAAVRRTVHRAMTLGLLAAALTACAQRHEPTNDLRRVAEGVYVAVGALAEPSAANRGEIATLGFVAGEGGTLAIDTGTSVRQAARLEREAQSRGLPPVRLAVDTAVNGERVFGNGHYADRELYAHPEAAKLMRERCDVCLARLHRELGEDTMAGTTLVVPDRAVRAGDRLRAGDREVEVLDFGWSASPGAIALWDPRTRTLFAGGLAAFGRIPEVRDAQLDVWLAAIDQLVALGPQVVVPGWGPPGGREDLLVMRGYLVALRARVEAMLEANVGLVEATAEGELPAYRDWPLYERLHRRNVHDLYVALERERFERPAAPLHPR
jgi:glyoxylase-like metal-dependent hydrolase (beta-lactamase superfamily II)